MNVPNGSPLEVRIGTLLRQKGWKLATAESCTGGLIGDLITNVAGSSDYYLGGVVAYAYAAKETLLGVRHDTLDRYGAVSPETVVEMVRGVCRVLKADVGISVSGIAGPGGGMPGKPVGLVWFGILTPESEQAVQYQFYGSRVENKAAAAHTALRLLVEAVQGELSGAR